MRTGYISDNDRRGYTDTLDCVVKAICTDYGRREAALLEGTCSKRTAMEYRFINTHVFDAAAEIVGDNQARLFIDDIGERIGYAYSKIDCYSESMYKLNKQLIKLSIARKLHLLD